MKLKMVNMSDCKPISISFDCLARAVYITFSTRPINKTIRKDSSFAIDYDIEGKIVGIEIIRIKKAEMAVKKILKDTENFLSQPFKEKLDDCLNSAGEYDELINRN